MVVPRELRSRRFADGSPVIRDEVWRGRTLMLKILQGLDKEDSALAREKGWQPYRWADTDQRDTAHNPRLMKVVQRAIWSYGLSDAEVARFLAIDPASAH